MERLRPDRCESCGRPAKDAYCKRCAGKAVEREVAAANDAPEFTLDWESLRPLPDLGKGASWDTEIVGCHFMAGGPGSEGAFLVICKEGAVVVKTSGTAKDELAAAHLAAKLGIAAPATRVLPAPPRDLDSATEGAVLIKSMRSAPWTNRHDMSNTKRLLIHRHILVMEFLKGQTLVNCPADMLLCSDGTCLGKPGEEHCPLFQLGRICVFDMVINNFDRLPLVWNNQGNANNVMLKYRPARDARLALSEGSVVVQAIDQAVVPITNEEGLIKYKHAVESVMKATDAKAAGIEQVRSAIHAAAGVDPGPGGMAHFLSGMRAMQKVLAALEPFAVNELMSGVLIELGEDGPMSVKTAVGFMTEVVRVIGEL